MDIKTAREVAARVWCDQEMSSVEMDVVLAEAIARIILKAAQQSVQRIGATPCEICGGINDNHDAGKHHFVRTNR